MSYQIEVSAKAQSEISKARIWYAEQSYGLEEKFISDLKIEIESLLDPRIEHKLFSGRTRRLLMSRFPYVIYYIRDTDRMIVHISSVLHNRQLQNIG
ncbi:MAG: hypothetical protein JWO03_1228 [Bacteroidetes bacterium]|nr:hypothetical protein [Bacteroidota bacterium]